MNLYYQNFNKLWAWEGRVRLVVSRCRNGRINSVTGRGTSLSSSYGESFKFGF